MTDDETWDSYTTYLPGTDGERVEVPGEADGEDDAVESSGAAGWASSTRAAIAASSDSSARKFY